MASRYATLKVFSNVIFYRKIQTSKIIDIRWEV